MAIKLYNKSRCPDEILRPIITAAGRRIGANTNVVVKVMGPTRTGHQGSATCGMPYLWHLTCKRQKGDNRRKLIQTAGGWIELHLPCNSSRDSLLAAENFYELCLHEWHHVREFQEPFKGHRFAEYRRRHHNRPHERRAIAATRDAKNRPLSHTAEEAILSMALWMETSCLGIQQKET